MVSKAKIREKFREKGFGISYLGLEKLDKEIREFVEKRVEELVYGARLRGKKRI